VLDLLTDLMGATPAPIHAEARHVTRTLEQVLVRDGRVDRVDTATTEGIGVRVRALDLAGNAPRVPEEAALLSAPSARAAARRWFWAASS
jgi:predicted Zn-dependent protease